MTEQAAELWGRETARCKLQCGTPGLRLVSDPVLQTREPAGSAASYQTGELAGGGTDIHSADAQRQLGTADLISRVLAGETEAFEPLYRAHAGHVYALCLRMSGDPARARDFVQDAFVRAWEQLGSYRGESAFGTWLHRLTVNVVLADMRSAQRRALHAVTVAELDDDDAVEWPPATTIGSSDDRMDLDTAIAALPPGARVAFVLHDIEGYSHAEIGALTGLAAGTIRAQLFRARQLLMKALA